MSARWVWAGLMVLWILVSLSIPVQLRVNSTSPRAFATGGTLAGTPVSVLGCAQAPCPEGT